MSNSFKTFLKHTAKDFHNQSVNPPIVRASTIIFKSMQDIRKTQDKAKKTLQVDTLIMEDKEPQRLIFFSKFYLN
jgi:cystathionine beta-lyase/cystathionine gamma-synthase